MSDNKERRVKARHDVTQFYQKKESYVEKRNALRRHDNQW
jgi:hypothetical protein